MDDVTALYVLTALLIGIGIGYMLRAEVQPWLARWIDRRDSRGG